MNKKFYRFFSCLLETTCVKMIIQHPNRASQIFLHLAFANLAALFADLFCQNMQIIMDNLAKWFFFFLGIGKKIFSLLRNAQTTEDLIDRAHLQRWWGPDRTGEKRENQSLNLRKKGCTLWETWSHISPAHRFFPWDFECCLGNFFLVRPEQLTSKMRRFN